jgi:hypothetical protein
MQIIIKKKKKVNMEKYVKETPRINVKFINSDTDEVMFEVNGRNCTNVNELFSDYITTSLVTDEFKKKKIKTLPKKIMVMAICEFNLV